MANIAVGQEINLTFSGVSWSSDIVSVLATNTDTDQSITIPGDETLILELSTGVETINEIENIAMLFPNPFSNNSSILIRQSQPEMVVVTVRNLLGQTILKTDQNLDQGLHSFSLSLANSGVYLIEIEGNSKKASIQTICTASNSDANKLVYSGMSASTYEFENSKKLKGQQSGFRLGYSMGDLIKFTCKSGKYTSIITDSPTASKNYEVEFVPCTDPDNKTYDIVKIGNQTWMAENMAYLPEVSPGWDESNSSPYYYVYDYNGNIVSEAKETENYKNYGALYNWEAAVMVCPDGWHLFSATEWTEFANFFWLFRSYDVKSSNLWRINDTGFGTVVGPGNNSSGFNAKPGGGRYGGFTYITERFISWITEVSSDSYDEVNINYQFDHMPRIRWGNTSRSNGLSVRCIKDNTPPITAKVNSDIYGHSAVCEGEILFRNNEIQVVARGAVWNESGNPTLEDSKTIDSRGEGKYNSVMTNLNPNTQYFVRAYATTNLGKTTYSEQVVFKTIEGSFTDTRDNNKYGIVSIGDQLWMGNNLAFLPKVSPPTETSKDDPNYYVYDYQGDDIAAAKLNTNYNRYGVLYNKNAAEFSCPERWHLPRFEEWGNLQEHLGENPGYKMKSTFGWDENGHGDNSSGFNVFPGGLLYDITGVFSKKGKSAYFWTGEFGRTNLDDGKNYLEFKEPDLNNYSMSVRCIRNKAEITTLRMTRILDTSAVCGGISFNYDDHESEILSRGVCWSQFESPSLMDNITENGSGVGEYVSYLSGLLPGTSYFVRAYITTVFGDTIFGNQVQFSTAHESFTDARDSVKYGSVIIGTQTWMAENLNFVPSGNSWCFNDEAANCEYYGRLYPFEVAKTVCPEGWHLPQKEELASLISFLGDNPGAKMKSIAGWFSEGNGDNSSHFNAIPGGFRFGNGDFSSLTVGAHFWSASEYSEQTSWHMSLYFRNGEATWTSDDRNMGFSVRCLKTE